MTLTIDTDVMEYNGASTAGPCCALKDQTGAIPRCTLVVMIRPLTWRTERTIQPCKWADGTFHVINAKNDGLTRSTVPQTPMEAFTEHITRANTTQEEAQ